VTILRDEQVLNAFGKHLAKLRQSRGLTQKELAFRASMEVARVSRIERGVTNATLITLLSLANGLDMPVSKLVTFDHVIRSHR
jgi:transcriptional regulator with XRE-family HTH domain